MNTPKVGQTFTVGYGETSQTGDVTRIDDTTVFFVIRGENEMRDFQVDSIMHQLLRFWPETEHK